MKRYVKHPEPVDAAQWTGDNLADFPGQYVKRHPETLHRVRTCPRCKELWSNHATAFVSGQYGLHYETLHPGDWFVRDSDSGMSFVLDEVSFKRSYQEVATDDR